MNTNMLPKYCIFNFPPSELSKIKCKSDYFGNERSWFGGGKAGGFHKDIKWLLKKTEECSRLELPFLLQCGLQILGSCRKQSLRQSLWAMALCRRVTLGEQRRESREGGGAWWGRMGGLRGSLLCIFILFSRCTHLPGFQDHVILLWLVLFPRPWSQRPPIPCLLWVRIYLTRHQQPLISPGLVTRLPRQPVGNP